MGHVKFEKPIRYLAGKYEETDVHIWASKERGEKNLKKGSAGRSRR